MEQENERNGIEFMIMMFIMILLILMMAIIVPFLEEPLNIPTLVEEEQDDHGQEEARFFCNYMFRS